MRLQHYLGGLENLGPVNFLGKKCSWRNGKSAFLASTRYDGETRHLDKSLPKYPLSEVPTTFKDT